MKISKTPTYDIWDAMKQRCLNPNDNRWKDYGGRGITICQRWMDYRNFLADIGERPEGRSLDRFPDNNGNYEPGNCRWATRVEQQNNMRSNVVLSHNGKSQTVAQWAAELGINKSTLSKRLSRGNWDVATALTTPALPFEERWKHERQDRIRGNQ